ncbi:GNAT family N-acetyltransferase [Halopseudomonas salegens]|uniref:L-ornithine N(alpha)-acyltransferase n=1 Tax=Halopseudomonas salegens TaxID=1434072 RepID=A0A1H2FWN6_9GAMM|nr:ornithine-acyl[acyl carrier protein] N-acyltransferase [Halopseudomonas salegens]
MQHNAYPLEQTERRFVVELAHSKQLLEAAQKLRYQVFRDTYGAELSTQTDERDQDHFDLFCEHLIVRDLHTDQIIATTRLLDSRAARLAGGFYSESEFQLVGLNELRGNIVEIGRTCVHPAYRSGACIATLWSGIAQMMNSRGYSYLIGCASIGVRDGGLQAHAVMQRLRERYLSREWLNAIPRLPLPEMELPANVTAQLPPLLKAYMRLGAQICGEPCWDPAFNVADIFILLRRESLSPRYARHFKAG